MNYLSNNAKYFVEQHIDLIDKEQFDELVSLMYYELSQDDAELVYALFLDADINLQDEALERIDKELASACQQFNDEEMTEVRAEYIIRHYLRNTCGLPGEVVLGLLGDNADKYEISYRYDNADDDFYVRPKFFDQ